MALPQQLVAEAERVHRVVLGRDDGDALGDDGRRVDGAVELDPGRDVQIALVQRHFRVVTAAGAVAVVGDPVVVAGGLRVGGGRGARGRRDRRRERGEEGEEEE
jgi:hypothetical protein